MNLSNKIICAGILISSLILSCCNIENGRQETNNPFLDEINLGKFTHEMESIDTLYPNHSYNIVDNFKWEYPNYLHDVKRHHYNMGI